MTITIKIQCYACGSQDEFEADGDLDQTVREWLHDCGWHDTIDGQICADCRIEALEEGRRRYDDDGLRSFINQEVRAMRARGI